jgi:hypothetical protein
MPFDHSGSPRIRLGRGNHNIIHFFYLPVPHRRTT